MLILIALYLKYNIKVITYVTIATCVTVVTFVTVVTCLSSGYNEDIICCNVVIVLVVNVHSSIVIKLEISMSVSLKEFCFNDPLLYLCFSSTGMKSFLYLSGHLQGANVV